METTIESYAEDIRSQVAERLGAGYEVEIRKVTKNNGITLTGLVVKKAGENLSPTIYLDGFYGDRRWDAADEIAEVCVKSASFKGGDITEKVTDAAFARERLCYRLVNGEKNTELLERIPHRDFLDLSIVYYLSVDAGNGSHASILVDSRMARCWGMSEPDLYRIARENTPRLFPAETGGLADVLRGALGVFPLGDGGPDLRIVTNKGKFYGAAAILYDGVLEAEAERAGGDIYVLPSSVHEVLVLKKADGFGVEGMAAMIREINESEVSPEEVLSDSLYCYSKERGLWIAGEEEDEG